MSEAASAPGGAVDAALLKEAQTALKVGLNSYRHSDAHIWAEIIEHAIDDPELLAIAARGKAPPYMFMLVAAAYLAADAPDEPLARYMPIDAREPGPADGVFPVFREFVLRRKHDILDIISTRTVQSTAVERAGYVLPLLDYVADLAGEPLNLIEIGCSAGLLTMFDRYLYDYGEHGRVGDEASTVVVPHRLIGDKARSPRRIPQIAERVGIDLRTIDAKSDDERRWLLAQVYPESSQSRARIAAALDVVARSDLRTVEGDATAVLPSLLQEMQGPLCVLHSACVYYFSREAQDLLDRHLREASRGRVIHRIGVETPTDSAGETSNLTSARVDFHATHTVYENCEARGQVVAICQIYGAWMEWLV